MNNDSRLWNYSLFVLLTISPVFVIAFDLNCRCLIFLCSLKVSTKTYCTSFVPHDKLSSYIVVFWTSDYGPFLSDDVHYNITIIQRIFSVCLLNVTIPLNFLSFMFSFLKSSKARSCPATEYNLIPSQPSSFNFIVKSFVFIRDTLPSADSSLERWVKSRVEWRAAFFPAKPRFFHFLSQNFPWWLPLGHQELERPSRRLATAAAAQPTHQLKPALDPRLLGPPGLCWGPSARGPLGHSAVESRAPSSKS